MGQCRSKTVTPVYSGDSPDSAMDSAFLGVIGTNQEPTWKMKLQLSGQETEFKLDTGAEVTAISDQTFQGIAGCQLTVPSKKLYDPNVATKISADASSYGLGAVLLQEQRDSTWKPVAYASRSMTKTETQYAQVAKEALAIT